MSEFPNGGYSRARLRPRKNTVNYKDTSNISILLEKSISPDKRNSVVILEKIDPSKINKKPIYKTVKPDDDDTEVTKDKVYDFQFDVNDSKEKSTKNKKKKKVAKKSATTRKKKINTLSENNNNNEAPKLPERSSKTGRILIKHMKKVTDHKKLEPIHKDIKNTAETGSNKSSEKHVHLMPVVIVKKSTDYQKLDPIRSNIENAEEPRSETSMDHEAVVLSPGISPPTESIGEKKSRVRICNVERLTGDRKVSFKPNLPSVVQSTAKFNPFRSTQSLFRSRSTMIAKDMMEHSLLNKSLSPIKVDQEPLFNDASPWRPPLPDTFSSVKQVVQSTPQIKRNFGGDAHRFGFRIDENNENVENAVGKASPMAKPSGGKSRNPLGVRISNEENIQASSSKVKEPLSSRETNLRIPNVGLIRKPLGIVSNYHENRKNIGFGDRLHVSPRKSDNVTISQGVQRSRGFRERNSPLLLKRKLTHELSQQKKVAVVSEGENSPPKGEEKITKQSNLNSFLNKDEMPESIMMNTSHGIFGEAHSTPIVKTKVPRIQQEANIDNCFGFDDECYSADEISAINSDGKRNTPVKKTFDRLKRCDLPDNGPQRAARISLGEIKNTLYLKRENKFEKFQPIEESKKKNRQGVDVGTNKNNTRQKDDTKSKKILNLIQFSDTFDVFSENEQLEQRDKSVGNEIALFEDLEPLHFTKPARWSYTRRRERKQHWSSDEEDSSIEEREVQVLKKRRVAKIQRAEDKKINEWVKSVNDTFQEIDNFDLVVEKLP